MIISDGFNGTPSKSKPNVCENIDGETHWWVLHGEANAILKCAKHGQSCDEATLYQTHSPCKDCSKLILQAGIKRVVYIEDYKDCETEEWTTHWYVIHAEANAILKCAKHGHSCDGATIYQTHSPCKECSKLILQSGIKRVVYSEDYKDSEGIDFLKSSGVKVEKIEI